MVWFTISVFEGCEVGLNILLYFFFIMMLIQPGQCQNSEKQRDFSDFCPTSLLE